MPIVLNAVQIQKIIRNLQPNPALPYTVEYGGNPLDSAYCGFVTKRDDTSNCDLATDFGAGRLQICGKKHYEWINFIPAAHGASSSSPASPNLGMIIAKALSSKGPALTANPPVLHKLQFAQQNLEILQKAYGELASNSAFSLIAEILKQFGYEPTLENISRDLTHNKVNNLWELKTEGNIVLPEAGGPALNTKIHFTSLATLSTKVEETPRSMLIWKGSNPPSGLFFKSASEHGFLLQQMTVEDALPVLPPHAPPPTNQVGITAIIDAFAQWDSMTPGSCTFLEQLTLLLQSQSAFGNKPSPDFASVLTHRLRQAVPSPMTPTQTSAVEKLKLALRGEQVKTVEFSHYRALIERTPATANILTFPEIIALNIPPMKEHFLALKPLPDQELFKKLQMITGLTVHMPSQTPDLRAITATREYGFTRDTTPGKVGLITQFYQEFNKAGRTEEFKYNFGLQGEGYGLNAPGTEDGDYASFLQDFPRDTKLHGKNSTEWLPTLETAESSPEVIALKVIEDEVLKKVVSSNTPKLAQIHLEIIKRIYNQSVGQLQTYLMGHINVFLGLDWSLFADPSKNSTVNLEYNQNKNTWNCISIIPQILKKTGPGGDPVPLGNLTYTTTCSFQVPDLSSIDASSNIATIFGIILDPKGFVIDKITLAMTRSGRSDYEREKHIYLMYLVFKWSITQEEIDRQNLLHYFFNFTS